MGADGEMTAARWSVQGSALAYEMSPPANQMLFSLVIGGEDLRIEAVPKKIY
jgi:hypothetical protein